MPSAFRKPLVPIVIMVSVTLAHIPLCLAQDSAFAITHVSVIDVARGKVLPDMTVVVRGTNIESVAPSRQVILPKSTMVAQGRGKFIVPGLWDMHVHFRDTDRDLKMDVANGVLGIRNMGAQPRTYFRCATRLPLGSVLGQK